MLGQGGNIGMSSSAPGTGQAPTMQAPQIPHLESSFMQGLRTMRETTVSQLALSQAGLADTQGKRIETLLPLEQSQILGNIDYMKKLGLTEDERRELIREQTEALFEQNSFTRLTAAMRLRQQISYTNQAESEATLASLSVQEQQFVAQYFDKQAWVNFATSLQGLANMVIEEKDSRISLNNIAYQYEQETFQIRKDILSASLTGMQLSNENQRIQNEYLPMEKQIALGLQVQQMANMIATEHLTYAQAKESLTRSILNSAQSKYYGAMTENVEIDTKQKQLDYNTASRLAEDYNKPLLLKMLINVQWLLLTLLLMMI